MAKFLIFSALLALFNILFFSSSSVHAFSLFGDSGRPKALWSDDPNDYGVDWSFPIHHRLDKSTYFGKRYNKMMKGCYEKFSKRECDGNEDARIEMNLDQPRTQHNYTELGFKKIRIPDDLFKELLQFYEENKKFAAPEQWPRANTYVNNWESTTMMVSFENRKLRGGLNMKQKLWDGLRPIVEEWTGKTLTPVSLYGIREYKRGAVLATHVDRLPLVSSMIIQVAQDVDEPWPVEVYSHNGKAYNVTMVPGDGVLYESHTVLHGRPFPLNGNNYANVFVHYIPIDHDLENEKDKQLATERMNKPPSSSMVLELEKEMSDKLKNERKIGGHEHDNHADHVAKKHMAKYDNHENHEEEEIQNEEEVQRRPNGRTALHEAAATGDLKKIDHLLRSQNLDILHAKDENEWQAIHEAARAGHLETLKFLIDKGADIGAATSNGGTALWWARRSLDENHELIKYLVEIGAPEGEEL